MLTNNAWQHKRFAQTELLGLMRRNAGVVWQAFGLWMRVMQT